MTIGASLPHDIVVLLRHVTSALGENSARLTQQAMAATIVDSTPTMLNVAVPPDTPLVTLEDGPTPSEALVYDEDRLIGELIVWVRAGRLIGMEQAWYTDEAPTAWPKPEQVTVR